MDLLNEVVPLNLENGRVFAGVDRGVREPHLHLTAATRRLAKLPLPDRTDVRDLARAL
jgi:hypothetical protein